MYRLSDTETKEVSLVRRGANRKVLIKKQGEQVMLEQIQKLLAAGKIDEAKVAAVLKAANMPEDVQAAIMGALKLFDAVKDKLPEDVLAHVAALSGLTQPVNPEKDADVTKSALAKLPDEVRLAVEKQSKEQNEKIAKMEKQLKDGAEAELDRESIAKAEALAFIPNDKKVIAALFKSVNGIDKALGKTIEDLLTSVNAILGKSEVFKQKGSDRGAAGVGSVMERVNKMAEDRIAKSAKPLTHEQAVDSIFRENKKLYSDYLAGN